MTVTAYTAQQAAIVNLPSGGGPAVIVLLRLPTTGIFVVFGKVIVQSLASPTVSQVIATTLTTLDGTNNLDQVVTSLVPAEYACVSLQGILNLSAGNTNEIVDIRYSAQGSNPASAIYGSLIAIPVDAVSGSVA